MICQSVSVQNFRNIESASVSFSPGVNVLLGANAQGKTNLLEALYIAGKWHSFRAGKDSEWIAFGQTEAHIDLSFFDSRNQSVSLSLFADKRRQVLLNKNKINRRSDLAGRLRFVLFCPEQLALVKGAPAVRREFLDEAISDLRPMYSVSLEKYERILKERNTLLKSADRDRNLVYSTIPYWSEQLAHEAAVLSRLRELYVKKADEVLKTCFEGMSRSTGAQNEIPELQYLGSAGLPSYEDLEKTQNTYLELLSLNLDREIAAGVTLYGPHRDDMEILLGGKPARYFASQGQQRSLSLALKLAEGEIVKQNYGEYPVFLFDDVLSELDFARRKYLIEEIRGKQVILTTCEMRKEDDTGEAHIIHVENGSFSESLC